MPEMSLLTKRRSEPAIIGKLFRFHPSRAYGSIGCLSSAGKALRTTVGRCSWGQRQEYAPAVLGRMQVGAVLDLDRLILRFD